MNTSQNEENIQLRRDKMILSDHVADLKSQVFLLLYNIDVFMQRYHRYVFYVQKATKDLLA